MIGNAYTQKTLSFGTGKTWSAVTNGQAREQTVTVPGLRTTDVILRVKKPTEQDDLFVAGYRVSAADTLSIQWANVSAAPITPTALEEYELTILRVERPLENHAFA